MAKKPGENDYTSGTKKGERPDPSQQSSSVDLNQRRWWKLKGSACANSIGGTVDFLQKAQAPRIRQQVINQSLYGNRRLTGAQGAARARLLAQNAAAKQGLITYNAVQSIVDTATSKIGESKSRAYFLTSGGSYKQQRKAKNLNKYIEGVWYENRTNDLRPQQFRNCAIDGDGFIFAREKNGRIAHEVVSGLELWIDEEEAAYGKPRTMFRNMVVDREELAAAFPESHDVIMQVAAAKDSVKGQTVSDMLSTVEAWHIGSENEDGDMVGGFHAVALLGGQGAMLVEPEDWAHPFFPFSRLPWCLPPTGCGYWSQSLAEQLQGEQIELNKELQLVQKSMHLAGVLKILTPVGSKVVDEHINNEIGTVLKYTGDKAPQFFCPEPIHQSFFDNPNRIIERMYRKAGVSEMSASAKKAPGLNAGVAIREFEDIESERHKTNQRQYDSSNLELADISIALSIEAAAAGRLKAVRVPGKQSFDKVDFSKDLKGLKRSEFTLHCYSVSRLPKDPAGQLETIQEYIQAGMISLRRGRKLLDFPDLDAEETLANAQETIIERNIEQIVDGEGYTPPEPTDDLPLSMEMVIESIQHYRALDLEEERLNHLRTYLSQVQDLMAVGLSAAAPQAGASPQAAPMPPPQSDLIPNAPGAGMARAA